MIYFEYLITALIVVILSIKASNYVDLLDRNTNLSGAFLGGIMLSAVTSLPELFTSLSATVMLDRPGLCLGNILGSDLFNLSALSFVILMFAKTFSKRKVSVSYRHVAVFVLCIYLLIALNFLGIGFRILHLSLTSILIFVIYVLGAKYIAVADDVEADEETLTHHAEMSTKLTGNQIGVRFLLSGFGIIMFSVILTYLADDISADLHLGHGFTGALFLGIATSLPEVTTTITLFKMKNVNIAVGNIIGSNLFNFLILTIADFFSVSSGVYANPDAHVIQLLAFGAVATALFWVMLKFRNKTTQTVCPLGMIACYLIFLAL